MFDLYQKSAAGTGEDELLLKTPFDKTPLDWSPDGRYLLYEETNPDTTEDLWALPLVGDGPAAAGRKPMQVVATSFSERWGLFSPDGRWIAYSSSEAGLNEVFVQTFPPSGRKWQVSTNQTGFFPAWRPDGREIFYDQSGQMMAVEVTTTAGDFKAGIPQLLFRGLNYIPRNNYDVGPSGRRFLVLSSAAQLRGQQSPPLTVVLNWMATAGSR